MGCSAHQAESTREAGDLGVGLMGELWHVKEIVPRLTEFRARFVQKSHFLQSLRSKAIIFGTPTLPFIKAQTLLSHRSLPWLLAFMSILTSPFLPKMAVLAEEVKKTVCPRPAAN